MSSKPKEVNPTMIKLKKIFRMILHEDVKTIAIFLLFIILNS